MVGLARSTGPSRIALAREGVHTVHTTAVRGACLADAVVDVGFTIQTSPPSRALASELVNSIHTIAVAGACLARAIVNVGFTITTHVSNITDARIFVHTGAMV
jgi:hypothetical protein